MNEFEWRRQLRELRQPAPPQRDLWPSIDAALEHAEQAPLSVSEPLPRGRVGHRRSWLVGAAVAAMLVISAGVAWRVMVTTKVAPGSELASTSATWKPSDPRLAGAAIELDAARMELKLALQQSPDSAALQRLLNRTKMQQNQLRQFANQAG